MRANLSQHMVYNLQRTPIDGTAIVHVLLAPRKPGNGQSFKLASLSGSINRPIVKVAPQPSDQFFVSPYNYDMYKVQY